MVGLASSLVGVGVVRMCVCAFSGWDRGLGFWAGSGGGLSGWGGWWGCVGAGVWVVWGCVGAVFLLGAVRSGFLGWFSSFAFRLVEGLGPAGGVSACGAWFFVE